jgi:hypothetical protein
LSTGGIGNSKQTEFKEGQIYEVAGEPDLCKNGFHFYKIRNGCFGCDLFGDDTVFHEIISYGTVVSDTEKCVCTKIKIGPKITLDLNDDSNSGNSNSGNRNSGYSNSGNRNSGYSNSGNRNSGNRNSGNWNSGYWNSCDYESGCFNSVKSDTIRVFNKPINRDDWNNAKKPHFIYFEQRNGESYKDAFRRSWNEATNDDRKLVEQLPGFDWDIFTEISGIEKL